MWLDFKEDLIVIIDADSICHAAAYKDSLEAAKSAVESRIGEIKEACKSENVEIWVEAWEGKHIFRKDVAFTLPYKGNRPPLAEHIKSNIEECKQYIVKYHGAQVTSDLESEDRVLIRATELGKENCIVAYIDKDLLQVPMVFYNYNKKEFIDLSEEQANFNLYQQILTGDKGVDNIPGLFKIGPKKAEKIVNAKTEDIPRAVAYEYKRRGHTYEYLVEQSRLIYLLRYLGEVFEYPLTQEEYDDILVSDKELIKNGKT